MTIDTALIPLLPDFYKDIKDYQQIMHAEERELEKLALFLNVVHDNFYIQSMDAETVASWETILGVPSSASEDLEFRRSRLINRLTTTPPFTLPFLYSKLDELLGEGKWRVVMDYSNYTIYVEAAAETQSYALEVLYTINQLKPAHIVYVARPLISETILEGEQIAASGITHHYRLGTWSLGARPFSTLYSEVVYKMPNVTSIKSAMLNGIATYVSGVVEKARINGSIVITNLTKSSSGAITTISYPFGQAQASTITKIELLDSSDNVLSNVSVYIPVASDLQITHTLTTKEGN